MSRLIAGPWVGEFGWELFLWQVYVRSLSKYFNETICIGRSSSRYLYRDFCTKYIDFNKRTGPSNMWLMNNFNLDKFDISKVVSISSKDKIIIPNRFFKGHPSSVCYKDHQKFFGKNIKPKYVRFGQNKASNSIIFHARNRSAIRPEDNWSLDNWKKLADLFGDKKIYSIGTKNSSIHIPGTEDFRDKDLNQVCNIVSSANLIIGPSSGPIHLASLCGTNQIVWSKKINNKIRYEKNWNPFFSKVKFLLEQNPSPHIVWNMAKDI